MKRSVFVPRNWAFTRSDKFSRGADDDNKTKNDERFFLNVKTLVDKSPRGLDVEIVAREGNSRRG